MLDACDIQLHTIAVHSHSTYQEQYVKEIPDPLQPDGVFRKLATREKKFETVTPGAGLLCDSSRADAKYGFGAYRNSLGKMTAYAGIAFQPIEFKNMRAGLFVGGATGYQKHGSVMIAPVLSVGLTEKTKVHFTIIPGMGQSAWALGLSLSWRP